MKLLLLIITCLYLTACAGKGIEFSLETNNKNCGTKTVEFATDYQVGGLRIERTIEGGGTEGKDKSEGCGGGYTISLDEGTTKDAQTDLMMEMLRMLRMVLIPGAAVPTVPSDEG